MSILLPQYSHKFRKYVNAVIFEITNIYMNIIIYSDQFNNLFKLLFHCCREYLYVVI